LKLGFVCIVRYNIFFHKTSVSCLRVCVRTDSKQQSPLNNN